MSVLSEKPSDAYWKNSSRLGRACRSLEGAEARRLEELEVRYGSKSALGARCDRAARESLLPDGSAAAKCTNYARFIRRLEPNTAIWGFSANANPESEIGPTFFGHDFALVDSRYIVDPWVIERAGMSERAVFDLEDPRDAPEIRRLYGDRATWVLMYPPIGTYPPRPVTGHEPRREDPSAADAPSG